MKISTRIATYLTAFLVAVSLTGYAASEKVVYSFTNRPDGAVPRGALSVTGTNFIGSTALGGSQGSGMLFKVSTNTASYSSLLSVTNTFFTGSYPWGIQNPSGSTVIQNGLIYGTMEFGGNYDSAYGRYLNAGAIYSIGTDGSGFTVVNAFGVNNYDGTQPVGGLIADNVGTMYGVTVRGGTADAGTVYRLTTNNQYSVLHNFGLGSDGAQPRHLVYATNGTLFGICTYGGANKLGTIFTISTNGATYSTLYSFTGGTNDSSLPRGSLLCDTNDGLIYGTCPAGGLAGYGVLWSIGQAGTNVTQVHSFSNSVTIDGATPMGGLIQIPSSGATNTIYGITQYGGTNDWGTVYMVSNGVYSVKYKFTAVSDIIRPTTAPVVGPDGFLYGVCPEGGTNSAGGVYRLTIP